MPEYRLVAFDLPFHGETIWREGLEFTIEDLMEIIRLCPETSGSLFGLMGFSLGGRICLSLLETQPELVEFLILLAPDGIRVNPWYRLATRTRVGNRIFRYTMKNPHWFFQLIKAGKKAGLVNESIFRFVEKQVGNKEMRNKVYMVWTTLRSFRPNLTVIRHMILQHAIPVGMIYGKFDRITSYRSGQEFASGLGSLCRLYIIEAGHQLLHPRHIEIINSALDSCREQNVNRKR